MLKPMRAISAAGGEGPFGTMPAFCAQPAVRESAKRDAQNHGVESGASFTFILAKAGLFFSNLLEFIFECPEQLLSPCHPIFLLYALGGRTVDDAHHTPPLFGLGKNNLEGVRSGAENVAHFLAHFAR